ncbi:UTP--glucose-1-phosphate uridylyltransferase GalU [soil metagenome]|jgi:UTP--glucose-1-phosphate uridylyltransferase
MPPVEAQLSNEGQQVRARKAVIPAAGLGTRFLPATKAQPKEMLPLVDKPAIQYVVEEAVKAGLDDILMVTGRGKRALEDHFDHAVELERQLSATGKEDLLAAVQAVTNLAFVHYVRQGRPLGLGHAIGCARHHVGDEPFAVLLGDDLIGEEERLLQRMVDICEESGRSVIAVMEFGDAALSRYGVVAAEPDPDREGVYKVNNLVEKPGKANAPSNLCIIGRYVLTPDVFEHISQTKPGRGGEIQLTDALRAQAQAEPIRAVKFEGVRYDVGLKADYLQATVAVAAQRHDLGPEFRKFLRSFVATMDSDGSG